MTSLYHPVSHQLYRPQPLAFHAQQLELEELSLQSMSHFSSVSYLGLTASQKRNQLWQEIKATDTESGSYPGLKLAEIFLESNDPTFHATGDVMPKGYFGSHRTKFIHCIARHGLVSLDTVPNPFTGLYQGATKGIVRLSSTALPKLGTSDPLGPGLSLKFLRDGMDSANVVAIVDPSGQPGEWNFFKHEQKNHVGAGGPLALKLVIKKFSQATNWTYEVGLSDIAQYTEAGVNEGTAVFPWRLDFIPNPVLTGMFSNAQPKDPMDYMNQLKQVPADSILYSVWGWTAPPQLGGKKVPIGDLKLHGSMLASKFGDTELFMRHQMLDEDIKLKPEWMPYYASYKLGGKCPYEKMLQELNLY